MRRATDEDSRETIAFYQEAAERLAIRWRDRTVMKPHLDRFASLLNPSSLVIDLGCGPGHDCRELMARGLRVVGVDLAFALLRIGQTLYPDADLARQDLRRLAVRSESIDGVWACASLLHVPRRQMRPVLSEMRRVLKAGGVLFTSMMGGRGQAHVQEEQQYGTSRRRLYVYYRPRRWRTLLQEAGFELLHEQLDHPGDDSLDPGACCWIASFAHRV